MNVDGGLKPRGISIFSICIFWIEVLSNFGRYNENDHCALFYFQVIDVLSKLAGLWVNGRNEIMYSQASQITFICPMIFNYFPLDTQVNFSLQFGIFSHASMLQHIFYFHLHFSRNIRFINTNYIAGVQISSRVLLLQHGKNDISCLSVRICAYIKVSTAVKLGNIF